jgi:hypothetical protein
MYSVNIKFWTKFIITYVMFLRKSLGQVDFILKNAILWRATCLNDVTAFCAMTSSPIFLNDNLLFLIDPSIT